PRVPLVIVSPYAKPGYTDSTATTFAGILAYTERTFNISPLALNDARAYPFTKAFNYSQAPLRPARMVPRKLPPDAFHINLKNANDDTNGPQPRCPRQLVAPAGPRRSHPGGDMRRAFSARFALAVAATLFLTMSFAVPASASSRANFIGAWAGNSPADWTTA